MKLLSTIRAALPTLPPAERKITNWSRSRTNPVLIEWVCIVPIGPGIWFPVRNLTKKLHASIDTASKHKAAFDKALGNAEAEAELIMRRIATVPEVWAMVQVQAPDGKREYLSADAALRKSVEGKFGLKLEKPAKSGVREVYTPAVDTRPSNHNNGKGKGGNNNQQH